MQNQSQEKRILKFFLPSSAFSSAISCSFPSKPISSLIDAAIEFHHFKTVELKNNGIENSSNHLLSLPLYLSYLHHLLFYFYYFLVYFL